MTLGLSNERVSTSVDWSARTPFEDDTRLPEEDRKNALAEDLLITGRR